MTSRTSAALAIALASAALTAQGPPAQQQVPTFRAGTIVVPLTVTVTDQKGAPVRDLTPLDFTVRENKRVVELLNFFPQEFESGPATPGEMAPARVTDAAVRPQAQRTFLIVLGYGRIEHPTTALEGAIELVNRLLPQDLVAVMGFHRTTMFTTDHKRIVQVLERFRTAHEKIVGDIDNYREMARAPVVRPDTSAGASAPSGNASIPGRILTRIDEIFLGPSAADSVTSRFLLNTAELLPGMDRLVPVVERPGQHHESFGNIAQILGDTGESLTDEVLLNTKLKLYAGVEYLRGLEGDKQMVFFSGLAGGGTLAGSSYRPAGRGRTVLQATNSDGRVGAAVETAFGGGGGGLARDADEATVIAQRASDARVVVNLIATNGTFMGGGGGDAAGQVVAELTGGYYTSLEMAAKAVGKVEALTRFSYLLGYAPPNPALDGTFRDVEVVVNRPGVTVRFRHGYFAAPEPPPLDFEMLVRRSRIERALAFDQQSTDIPLRVTVTPLPRMGIRFQTRVEIVIDAGPLSLSLENGLRTGQIELIVYCGDDRQTVIGDAGQFVDLSASEEVYQQWLQNGIRRTIRVPTPEPARYVKVVVYDHGSERIGSATVAIK
jgi:VWFA-related protein